MFGRRKRRERAGPVEEQLQAAILERAAGPRIQVDELPAAVGIVGLHADIVSSFGWFAAGPDGTALPTQPIVIGQPDPTEDRGETVEKIVQSLAWKGNAYGLLAGEGPRTTCHIVNPNNVGHVPRHDDDLAVDFWIVNGIARSTDDVVHWKINDDPRRGPLGRSPIEQCSKALIAYTAAYQYLANFFDQGGNPSSILKFKQAMDPAQMLVHIEEWMTARRERRPAGMPPHIDFEVPQSSGELQLVVGVLEGASAEIGRIFRTPPSITNAAVNGYSLSYSNVGDDLKRWLALALGPTWITAVARGFTKMLPDGVTARCDTTVGPFAELLTAPTPAPTSLEVPA